MDMFWKLKKLSCVLLCAHVCMCVVKRECVCVQWGHLASPWNWGVGKVTSQTLRSISSGHSPSCSYLLLLLLDFGLKLSSFINKQELFTFCLSACIKRLPTHAQFPLSVFVNGYEQVLCMWLASDAQSDNLLIFQWMSSSGSHSLALMFMSFAFTHTYSVHSLLHPQSSSLLFHQETSIIHEGSEHPQRVVFPLLQPYTSKLIHCSQYFKSQKNKGVTLRLMHSFTRTHAHRQPLTVHVMGELPSVVVAEL